MNDREVQAFFEAFEAADPHPRTELVYSSVFELLVAVLLSAQATDASVNKATPRLFARAPTPEAMLALGLDAVTEQVRSIGLYRTKAANLLRTCRLLVDRHDGQVPDTRDALEALPGVGRKTANVILNVAFGQPTIAVDTHVFRVSNRTGLATGPNERVVEQRLSERVPRRFLDHAHHWLILHGRYICLARGPRCGDCRVRALCDHGRLQSAGH